ncbi:MAG: hypothetical protein IJ760_02815 [Bacteroidales bacterium]|nr:hypothetical protein [Bacteroidales bacterium]
METQSHVTLVTKIVVSILWGIFSLVVGGNALYQHFNTSPINSSDLKYVDGTVSSVFVNDAPGKNNAHWTRVELNEYPLHHFIIPYSDEAIHEQSTIRLCVKKDEDLNSSRRSTVYAYETADYSIPLDAYYEYLETESQWGLPVGVAFIIVCIAVELAIWQKELRKRIATS